MSADRASLRLTRPRGGVLLLTVIFMAVLLGLCELVARTSLPRTWGLIPSVASVPRLAIALAKLDTFVAQEGGVDCVFLGNSVVYRGIDPRAFRAAYRRRAGRDIRCFNFGIRSIPVTSAADLAELVVQRYHPALLIYGSTARDYSPYAEQSAVYARVAAEPWVRYQLGEFTVTGWLTAHSVAYQYYLTHRNWMRAGYAAELRDRLWQEVWTWADGYSPKRPAIGRVDHSVVLADYRVMPQSLAGLQRIVRLDGHGVQVVLLEMPIPPTTVRMFPRGERDYQQFIDAVSEVARAAGVPFWRTAGADIVPPRSWIDWGHMNARAARIFGEWLGTRVAADVHLEPVEANERP